MNIVKTNLFEFTRGNDPFNTLGIGIMNAPKEFKTVGEFTDFIIKYSKVILNGRDLYKKPDEDTSSLLDIVVFHEIVDFFKSHPNFTFINLNDNFSDMINSIYKDINGKMWSEWVHNLRSKINKGPKF